MSSPEPSGELLEVAEQLYGLPLAEFTAARDARAKELKADAPELAAAAKALRKPTLAAWVVNLLVRRDPDQIAQLVAVGEALRDAAGSLDAGQLRELTKQRRQLTAAVTTTARHHAAAEGQPVTEAVATEVESTLTAAMLDASAAAALRSGLLVRPLSTTGLGDLDATSYVAVADALGHLATAAPATLRAVPDPSEAVRKREARQALARAEKELALAKDAQARAELRHRGVQAQMLQLESELDEARRKVAELETREEALAADLDRAAGAVQSTGAEVSAAEAARDALR